MNTKQLKLLGLSLIAGAGLALSHATADSYEVDASHAHIGFEIKHLVISKVRGQFTDFTGNLTIGDGKLTALEGVIQATSVNTANEKRDKHLRDKDFFEVSTHETITFKSTAVTADEITGDLTIHGVTQSISLAYTLSGPVEDPYGNTKVGLEASSTVDRTKFGMKYNAPMKTGGMVIGEKVKIVLDLEATKK